VVSAGQNGRLHRKETIMNAPAPSVSLGFAALNFDCVDPAALADFWGNVLGRPAGPGKAPGGFVVEETAPASGPRLIFLPVAQPEKVKNLLRPILLTEQYDQEIERLNGLGAKPLEEIKVPGARYTTFADPEGNAFDLLTWLSE
jgi:predicted enzyme related to lactoylglutathione lyase